MSGPRALIICDFPILAQSIAHTFSEYYEVVVSTWRAAEGSSKVDADFVVLDITVAGAQAARRLLSQMEPGGKAAVCSLHENEVQVYAIGDTGPTIEEEIPSLLSLHA